MDHHYSLAIHGGCGELELFSDPSARAPFETSLHQILESGRKMLTAGADALETVEHCTMMLEDDPLYNAGRGSVLNDRGQVEMDASIMNGKNLYAGAAANISRIKNPVTLARYIMENSEHIMLVGKGAMLFAKKSGFDLLPDDYFLTPSRINQWKKVKKSGGVTLDHDSEEGATGWEHKYGTVGSVARDLQGNLAAATSTGGMVNKKQGRVGDSPIIGAGVYADNETCGVSATGHGERFIRTVLSKTISDLILHQGLSAPEAAKTGIDYLRSRVKGLGGVIVVDRHGNCGIDHSTPRIISGYIEKGGKAHIHTEPV